MHPIRPGQPIYENNSTFDNWIVVVVQAISMSRISTDLRCKISGNDSSKLIVLLSSQCKKLTDPRFQLWNTEDPFSDLKIVVSTQASFSRGSF